MRNQTVKVQDGSTSHNVKLSKETAGLGRETKSVEQGSKSSVNEGEGGRQQSRVQRNVIE